MSDDPKELIGDYSRRHPNKGFYLDRVGVRYFELDRFYDRE
jgi:hypothetical protein